MLEQSMVETRLIYDQWPQCEVMCVNWSTVAPTDISGGCINPYWISLEYSNCCINNFLRVLDVRWKVQTHSIKGACSHLWPGLVTPWNWYSSMKLYEIVIYQYQPSTYLSSNYLSLLRITTTTTWKQMTQAIQCLAKWVPIWQRWLAQGIKQNTNNKPCNTMTPTSHHFQHQEATLSVISLTSEHVKSVYATGPDVFGPKQWNDHTKTVCWLCWFYYSSGEDISNPKSHPWTATYAQVSEVKAPAL